MKGPWSTPFDRTVQPGLRRNMIQQADGHTTILRPRRFAGVTMPPEDEGPTPPVSAPVCIPVVYDFVAYTPLETPLEVGHVYEFTWGGTGTAPITQIWYLNGVAMSTTLAFTFVLQDGDIQDKDEFGLGRIQVRVELTNACGEDGTPLDSGYRSAQGTPPP